jgi:ring-1,2-phenylacetyl-CoA epoxidase subunit PaaE
MGLFNIFKKQTTDTSIPKGFFAVNVLNMERLTNEAVQISFAVPESLKNDFAFQPGQYVDIAANIDGKTYRRSYSICSGPDEPLSIGVKRVVNGKVSTWINHTLKAGDELHISAPKGSFTLPFTAKNVVAIAAGSGITPILSMAKSIENTEAKLTLFYGNRTYDSVMFEGRLTELTHTQCTHYLSREEKEGCKTGRITQASFTEEIKADLDLLKSDAFFICGPEEMIREIRETLTFFGVAKEKIHIELFTTPTAPLEEAQQPVSSFEGKSAVTMILDDEVSSFTLDSKGPHILDQAEKEGLDVPFSCRGGVCASCKAKVLKGSAVMDLNFSLTDQEVKDGYILTCQAHPTSSELTISFDE